MKNSMCIAILVLGLTATADAETSTFSCVSAARSSISFTVEFESNLAKIRMSQNDFGGSGSLLRGRELNAPFYELLNGWLNYQMFEPINKKSSVKQLVQLRISSAGLSQSRSRMILEVAEPSSYISNEGATLTRYEMKCTRSLNE